MYHSFLIHSSADGYLGYFHVLAIINSAAMNIGVHVSLSVPSFFLKITLAIQGFLYFHTNSEIICSSSVKNTLDSLIGIALNL